MRVWRDVCSVCVQVKMLMMNLISRVIATHELLVLNFYPFLQKYMQPHQPRVTCILAYAAQVRPDLQLIQICS